MIPVMTKPMKYPIPTGDPWCPSAEDPATVPVPLPVIIVKVEGPYKERDRKLWTFLLHAVWDEIPEEEKLVIHEIPVTKINQVFRELGGDHNSQWIWDSAARLAKTSVEWEDETYKGIEALFGAILTKDAYSTGILRFYFPPLLTPRIKKANRFARLRVHFMVGLSGKYAVTLYELLESVVNKLDPILEVPLDTLRQWLKVPSGKLPKYKDFRVRVLQPAIDQINTNPLGGGFTVAVKPIKQGRAVQKLRFTVTKVNARLEFEKQLREAGQEPASPAPAVEGIHLSTIDYERAKAVAPRWDIYELERQWREWIANKPKPANPGAAFVAFCRKKAAKNNP